MTASLFISLANYLTNSTPKTVIVLHSLLDKQINVIISKLQYLKKEVGLLKDGDRFDDRKGNKYLTPVSTETISL